MPFRLANAPNTDYKALVKAAYDRCACAYAGQRCADPPRQLDLITERLPPQSAILDVGCGAGVPVARHLARHCHVTGVDISPRMIELARENVPSARFVEGDIMDADFPAAHFAAIVSFYALFHLPRQEHEALFRRFARWLKPGGLLLLTLAPKDDGPGYTDDFHGVAMYWSNFGLEVYRDILARAGFRLLQEGLVGHGYDEAEAREEEAHPFVFCTKADAPQTE